MTINSPRLPMAITKLLVAVLALSLKAVSWTPPPGAFSAIAADYYPLAVGNAWTYTIQASGSRASTVTWKITQQESIRGQSVFHTWAEPADGDEPLDLCFDVQGVFECGTDRYLIRNQLKMGQKWSARLQRPGGKWAIDQFEVRSESRECIIGGHHFGQCVRIQETDAANQVVSITTYAKSVGPVEFVYTKLGARNPDSIMTIKSWRVGSSKAGSLR